MKEIKINIKFVKDSIRHKGYTWEDLAKLYGCQPETVRRKVREEYTYQSYYQELSAKARENKKLKKEAAPVLEPLEEEIHEVIVTETGYLMKVGMEGILRESLDIIIPRFCMAELDKLSRSSTVASEILTMIWSTNRITQLKLDKEILFEDPKHDVKKRTIGIVAICCELFAAGMKVRLLTSSYDVAELAKAQGFNSDIKVELVQNP